MGRLLTISLLLLFSSVASANTSDLSGLSEKANLSGEQVVLFVKSGMETYSEDPVVKACIKKLEVNRNSAIYALFNYIMYLDMQKDLDQLSQSSNLKKTRQLMTVSRYAKKTVNYCNP